MKKHFKYLANVFSEERKGWIGIVYALALWILWAIFKYF